MPDFLVLDIEPVPAMSAGIQAVDEVRPSQNHLTRSQIIGMFAAALGIDRDDEDGHIDLDEGLGIAVLVVDQGRKWTDYQTVHSGWGKDLSARTRAEEMAHHCIYTRQSQREYLSDQHCMVAVWNTGSVWEVRDLRAAFQRPFWTLYLGRKSCVPGPIGVYCLKAGDLEAAFDAHGDLYTDEGAPITHKALSITQRRDRIVSRKAWTFGLRRELHARI